MKLRKMWAPTQFWENIKSIHPHSGPYDVDVRYVFTREELEEFCKHIHYAWDEHQETFEGFLKDQGCE